MLDIPFLKKEQYIVATFSPHFANQFIMLRKMIPGTSMRQIKNKMKGISNPIGSSGGSYLVFGPTPFWEKEGQFWLGGRGLYNPILHIVHYFLNKVKEQIPEYNPDEYLDKVGLVVTTRDHIQVPHLDVDRLSDNHSWIYHAPLCHSGGYIYIWENGHGGMNRELVKIPFGSCLILWDDIWHGGIVGGVGNIRFHGAIVAKGDAETSNHPVYGTEENLKDVYSELVGKEVDYTARNLLPAKETEEINDLIKFQRETLIFDELFYSNIYF